MGQEQLDDLPEPFRRFTTTGAPHGVIPHLGRRFDETGRFLSEPGNTVVCHLVEGSTSEAAVIAARASCRALPQADRLAFTPIPSLHMTLFQGIIEYRRRLPYWPSDMDLDMPIDAMTAHYLFRLRIIQPGPAFQVKAIELLPTGLTLEPVTATDRAAVAEWRNRLAEVFGYRHPDHDSYRLHITFAYMMAHLSVEAVRTWAEAAPNILAELLAVAPVIELAPPAFCRFANMEFFDELQVLRVE